MEGFDNLTEEQQQALSKAFGDPDGYDDISLRAVDDISEAAGYEVLHGSLEGETVSRGSMDEKKVESYKNIGFLKETEEGLQINSVWDNWQIEVLDENDMYEFDDLDIYVTESSERPETTIVSSADEAVMNIEDSLTYQISDVDSEESAQNKASEKVEELSKEFVEFFTGEFGFQDENDNMSSKSGEEVTGGDNQMTEEYNGIEDVNAAVVDGEIEDVQETADLIDQEISDPPSMKEAYLAATTLKYQALRSGENIDTVNIYQDALERVEEAGEAAKSAVHTTAENARDQIGSMEETQEGVRDAYVSHMMDAAEAFETAAQKDREEAEEISELNQDLEEVASDLEDVAPQSFRSNTHDQITEELEELREVSDLEE